MEKKPDERETGTDAGRFWSRRPAEFIVCWLQQMHMQWTAGLVPLTLRPPFPPPACKRQRMNWTLDNIRGGRVQRWKWIFKFFTGRFIFSPNLFFLKKKGSALIEFEKSANLLDQRSTRGSHNKTSRNGTSHRGNLMSLHSCETL